MGQDRLCGLAILSIENERARALNIQQIIDDFAERKARRMPLKWSPFLLSCSVACKVLNFGAYSIEEKQ